MEHDYVFKKRYESELREVSAAWEHAVSRQAHAASAGTKAPKHKINLKVWMKKRNPKPHIKSVLSVPQVKK